MEKLDFYKKVAKIQRELKAPKSKSNDFGKYKYRKAEDILVAANALLGDLVLILSDDVVDVSGRFYVKCTATITDGENSVSNSSFARESLSKKGMDDAQVTGSTSSYARKYALNGLFCIDDTVDSDDNSYPRESGVNSDVQTIIKAANAGDGAWINENWSGVISKNWNNLDAQTQNKLQGK